MKLMHPYVIDTSIIFNLTGDRNRKSKLQLLAKEFLNEDIQVNKDGHSSIEDSTACLKLTKLKLSKDLYFGDRALKRKVIEENEKTHSGIVQDEKSTLVVKTPMICHAIKRRKTSAIVTTENSNIDLRKFNSQNNFKIINDKSDDKDNEKSMEGIKHIKESTARDVIHKTREIIINNDFNLSHFNIFEDLLDKEDLSSEKVDEDEKISELVPKIDKWIEKVWSNVASNGLFVVIFGGRDLNTSGLSMVQIKN